jgi:predicted AlkP superfamily pyrophosphatase or phosphodiesterase
MYFSDMDDTGHRFGPNNNDKLEKALLDLDRTLGTLFEGVKASGLPVNIIIVSDHGMAEQLSSNLIPIDTIKNDSLFLAIDNGSIVNIHPNKNVELSTVFEYLKGKEANFKVYKTQNTPGFEYTPENKDWGSFQLIPDVGYYFASKARIASLNKNNISSIGVHGFDPELKDMHGIFYANGPAFKNGYKIPSIKNIHIYPLMCKLLDLDIPNTIDGELNQTETTLIKN